MSKQIAFENTARPDVVELRKVSHSYDGGKTYIIKDLDLLIEDKPGQGQFVVILGKSGCGKSTLLRYVAGLQTPTSGQVLVNEELRTKKHRVSMVFQQYSSFPWMTVQENVELGMKLQGIASKIRKEKAEHFLEVVGLAGQNNKFAKYPTLSGGQLQRVAIARCLVANPEILLMDEPYGALDTHTRMIMQNLLADLWLEFRPTIIFVTHDMAEAVYLGDDIYVMSRGPAQIVDHIEVPLPIERKQDMKHSREFQDTLRAVEESIFNS